MPAASRCPSMRSFTVRNRRLVEGWVMRADGTQEPDPLVFGATEADYTEIARLICSYGEIGKHYDVDMLVA